MSSPIVAIFSSAAVAAMTVYSAAVAYLYLNQDSLVFHPRPLNPTIEEALNGLAGAHPLEVTAGDGIRLKGWVVKREGEGGTPAPLLLYFGGNAEEIGSYLLEASQYLGRWSIAALNYRGYGASQGNPGEPALLSDAEAILADLQRNVAHSRLVVMGRSLGSGVAVHLASRQRFDRVVLVTPYDSLTAVAAARFPYVPVRAMLRHRFDSQFLAGGINTPALFLIAAQDEVVPPTHGRRLAAAWMGKRTVVEIAGAGHNDIQLDPLYWDNIASFLDTPVAAQALVPQGGGS